MNIQGEDNACKILIANKIDLEDEREITPEEGEEMAKLLDCEYREMCMKDTSIEEVKEMLDDLGKKILQQISTGAIKPRKRMKTVQLHDQLDSINKNRGLNKSNAEKSGGGCCRIF